MSQVQPLTLILGEVSLSFYLINQALDGSEWSATGCDHFIPAERILSTNCIGGRLVPRAGVDDNEKKEVCPCLESNPIVQAVVPAE
jgi:hypothetical protein